MLQARVRAIGGFRDLSDMEKHSREFKEKEVELEKVYDDSIAKLTKVEKRSIAR